MNLLALTLIAATALSAGDWSAQLAANYLDTRQKLWSEWKNAQAAGGACVSCHTGLTYLMARPVLRAKLGEAPSSELDAGLLNGLSHRMRQEKPVSMFKSFTKEPIATQAAAVEAVIAALSFSLTKNPTTETSENFTRAMDRMWSLQLREGPVKGSWPWFSLDLDPWEQNTSAYYGATLAAMATASAPEASKKQWKQQITDLSSYINSELDTQPLHHRLMALLASQQLPQLLSASAQKRIIKDALSLQQKDGSWTIASLGPWKEHKAAPVSEGGDAYATALALYSLQKNGCHEGPVQRGLDWLKAHQDPQTGGWTSRSLNKTYPADSMQAQFMSEAATSYAVLALLSQPACKESSGR